MDLIVVRHARPERDERADGQGTADPALSELGRRQALATAEFLAEEPIDHIAASPMRRARETALPLSQALALPIEIVPDLREVDHHSASYVPAEELTPDDDAYRSFVADPMGLFDAVGGVDAWQTTVVAAFEGLIGANRGRTVVVFCHGMVMGVYLRSLVGHTDPYKLPADYCGLMRVRASSAGVRSVVSMNETGHLRHLTG